MRYDKLVRDKIPELIKGKGEVCLSHVANDGEYWAKLKEKLVEEAEEFRSAPSVAEFADILEVLEAILAHTKFDRNEIRAVKEKKVAERGGFKNRIILEES